MFRFIVLAAVVAVCLASEPTMKKYIYQHMTGEIVQVQNLMNECNSVGQLGSTCPLDQFPNAKELPHCEKEENPPGFVFCSKTCCFDEGSNLPTCDLDGGLKFICT